MNLVIDVGNSVVKFALFRNNELLEVFVENGHELQMLLELPQKYSIRCAILATVVDFSPTVQTRLSTLSFPLLFLNHQTPLPLVNLYHTPQTLGYDRIAAAVGAVMQAPGRNLLIVDAGTAITYEFVDAAGRYYGGNISPGVAMRFKALHQFTSRLPLVDKEGEICEVGYNTETAIRSGVLRGIMYEIIGYMEDMRCKYPDIFVFLTGGDEFSFDSRFKNIIFADKFLVLKGLDYILQYNSDDFQ